MNNFDKIWVVEGLNREIVVMERVVMVLFLWKGCGGFRS